MTLLEWADQLDRVANHISETLYWASGAIRNSHSKADEKFIRHDDYDQLRALAKELRVIEYRRLLAEAEK